MTFLDSWELNDDIDVDERSKARTELKRRKTEEKEKRILKCQFAPVIGGYAATRPWHSAFLLNQSYMIVSVISQ